MKKKMNVLSFVLMLSLSACNFGGSPAAVVETPAAETLPPATETATEIPATPTVEHKTVPGELPEEPSGAVGDQDSSATADDHRAPGGDRFTFTRFERPFNSQIMDEYFSFIDIQSGFIYVDDLWIYAAIALKGDNASRELKGKYGLEIDLDLDGGGDWLILASNPVSAEWTTGGVEAWFDTNDDVGGATPMITDDNAQKGNGYETMEFGPAVEGDPDLAWVRISPEDPNVVHLAVKKDILNGGTRFLAGLWSGTEDLDPALFDLSDYFTHEQAGAALIELEIFYPIKELSVVDNTCRMAVGFQPTGSEPGICPQQAPAMVGEDPADAGCPPQYYVCENVSMIAVVIVCSCNQP